MLRKTLLGKLIFISKSISRFQTNLYVHISSGTTLQTTLKSTITDSNQITYKTRFWELPDDARNELALLAHFITEQTDKKDKIDQELGSYFGSTLKEMHTSALTMNDVCLVKPDL